MKADRSALVVIPILLATAHAGAVEAEFYGVAHLSADSVDDGRNRSEFLASNSSWLGLRGRQALSEGADLVFQYEQGVDLTGQGENDGNGPGSTSSLFTAARVSFLGVTGNYGTLRLGKLDGLNQWVYDYNLFADQVGDLGNLWGGSGLPGRITNAAQYVSPEYSGFKLGLTYVPDEGFDDADLLVLKADYRHSELKLGLALVEIGRDWQVGAVTGSYDWGNVTVGGGWQREESIADIRGNDSDSFTVGASLALRNRIVVKAQVVHSDATARASDATQYSVGLDYHWTEALSLYLALATTRNDDNAGFSANNYGKGDAVFPAAGQDPSAISLGVAYRFSIDTGKFLVGN
ncbi:MAG: porin [Thioalkalivibrio sp.]|nr:porin [Thioalkalivibrio sp.]